MKKVIKICLISDTHEQHEDVKIPGDIDILIHSGDFSSNGKRYQVKSFMEWLSKQEATHKVLIAGNHDFWFEPGHPRNRELKDGENPRDMIPDNVIYLEDETVEVEGLKIFGSPWTPWFYSWAFNAMRGDDIQKHWDLIEEGTDIVITHGPPANVGFLDACMDGQKVGCADLTKKIVEVLPTLSVFGHIHEGYGYTTREVMSEDGETVEKVVTFINASVLNHNYRLVNNPIVIEINENKEIISIKTERDEESD